MNATTSILAVDCFPESSYALIVMVFFPKLNLCQVHWIRILCHGRHEFIVDIKLYFFDLRIIMDRSNNGRFTYKNRLSGQCLSNGITKPMEVFHRMDFVCRFLVGGSPLVSLELHSPRRHNVPQTDFYQELGNILCVFRC